MLLIDRNLVAIYGSQFIDKLFLEIHSTIGESSIAFSKDYSKISVAYPQMNGRAKTSICCT